MQTKVHRRNHKPSRAFRLPGFSIASVLQAMDEETQNPSCKRQKHHSDMNYGHDATSRIHHNSGNTYCKDASVTTTATPTLSTFAIRRIQRELVELQKQDTERTMKMRFEVEDSSNGGMSRWKVTFLYDNETEDATSSSESNYHNKTTTTRREIKRALDELGLDGVSFGVVFPNNYPSDAPFVYNLVPRLIGPFVFSEGGLCLETLSSRFGWSCASRTTSLMISVRAMLEEAGVRVQRTHLARVPFTEEGARRDFSAISRIHSEGWSG